MSLKEHIFGSNSEKELYYHLKSIWGRDYNLYPGLKFANIFNIDNINITNEERKFLESTEIDYTVCTKKDKPLICIEFDGWRHGYSRDGHYVEILKDKWRKIKFELKLRIAKECNIPFVIVSSDEKNNISEKIHLSIIDSIIGQILAKIKYNEYCGELEDPELAEIVAEYENDPIVKELKKLEEKLNSKKILLNYTIISLQKPNDMELFIEKGLNENGVCVINPLKDINWYGCEISCETPKGKVIKQAWVRNFEGRMVSPQIIVDNIAKLVTFYDVAKLNNITI